MILQQIRRSSGLSLDRPVRLKRPGSGQKVVNNYLEG